MNAPDLYTTMAQVIPVFMLALLIEARLADDEPTTAFSQIVAGLVALIVAEIAALRGVSLGHRSTLIDKVLWVGLATGGLGFMSGVFAPRLRALAEQLGLGPRFVLGYFAVIMLVIGIAAMVLVLVPMST